MKLMLMPKEGTWWIWLVTAGALASGLLGHPLGFALAVVISAAQSVFFLCQRRSMAAFPVQIRIAYTVLLFVCLLPWMRWLFWLPVVGTFAFVLFGYCLMARVLSLMPWNRTEEFRTSLLVRTFLTPPTPRHPHHGLPDTGVAACACTLEARAAFADRASHPNDSTC